VILPEEAAEMQTKIFRRLENTVNEGMWFSIDSKETIVFGWK
jgi:hypothetical protein